MNIFDQAMEVEKEGESFYRQFSLEALDKGMKKVLMWLASQERKHYNIFKKLKEQRPASVTESAVLNEIESIFEACKVKELCSGVNASRVALYRAALEAEIRSISLYEKHANTAAAPQKEIFLKIAAEEKNHKMMMENIIKLATRSGE